MFSVKAQSENQVLDPEGFSVGTSFRPNTGSRPKSGSRICCFFWPLDDMKVVLGILGILGVLEEKI